MRRRISVTAAVAAAFTLALTGCATADGSAGSSQSAADCEAPLGPGMLSQSVSLTDIAEDNTPTVEITGGTDITNAQFSVIRESDTGKRHIQGAEVVTTNLTIFAADSGEVLQPTALRFLQPLPTDVVGAFSDFLASPDSGQLTFTDIAMAAMLCATPGDVLAVAITPEQAISSGLAAESLVGVIEIVEAQELRATGASKTLPWGFPAIASTDEGRPGVILPPQEAPTELKVALAIEGEGREIDDDSYVLGHVLTTGWDGELRQNSWEGNVVEIGAVDNPIYSFRAELSGYPLGSRVVILEPSADTTLVHVVDLIVSG